MEGGIWNWCVRHIWHSWHVLMNHQTSCLSCGHQNCSVSCIQVVNIPLCPRSSCACHMSSYLFPSLITILCFILLSFFHNLPSLVKNWAAYCMRHLKAISVISCSCCGLVRNTLTCLSLRSQFLAFSDCRMIMVTFWGFWIWLSGGFLFAIWGVASADSASWPMVHVRAWIGAILFSTSIANVFDVYGHHGSLPELSWGCWLEPRVNAFALSIHSS